MGTSYNLQRVRISDSPLHVKPPASVMGGVYTMGGGGAGEHDRDDAECCPFNRQRNEDKGDRAVQHSGRAKPGGAIIKALSRPSYQWRRHWPTDYG